MKTINSLEKKSQSDFGYFNHADRTIDTDAALFKAAQFLRLSSKDIVLWCDSSYARHFMDARRMKVFNFVKAINDQLPKLRMEWL